MNAAIVNHEKIMVFPDAFSSILFVGTVLQILVLICISTTPLVNNHLIIEAMSEKAKQIKFDGAVTEINDKYLLEYDSSSILISKDDAEYVNGTLHLQNGSFVEFNSDRQPAVNACPPRILATGREERIPTKGSETTCFVFVLLCHYCVYNEAGVFIRNETRVCGACVGLPF